MNNNLTELTYKKLTDLEKKVNTIFEICKIDNILDFVLNGGYIFDEDLDPIMNGTYL